jgi:hypothetical protein
MLETSALLSLIDVIYEGVLNAELWQAAIAAVCKTFGGDRGGMFVWDRTTLEPVQIVPVEIDPTFQRNYKIFAALPDMRPLWAARMEAANRGSVEAEVHADAPLWRDTALFEA